MAVQLRFILEEHNIRKLMFPSGIPSTVEELVSIVFGTLNVPGEFGLLYKHIDFGNQFFSLTSTYELYDKATVKIMRKEPMITLSSTLSEVDTSPADDEASPQVDDCASSSSQDTIILPESCRSIPWPVPFQFPQFSRDIEIILAEANKIYHAFGTYFRDASVESAIMRDLTKVLFSYTAYPSSALP